MFLLVLSQNILSKLKQEWLFWDEGVGGWCWRHGDYSYRGESHKKATATHGCEYFIHRKNYRGLFCFGTDLKRRAEEFNEGNFPHKTAHEYLVDLVDRTNTLQYDVALSEHKSCPWGREASIHFQLILFLHVPGVVLGWGWLPFIGLVLVPCSRGPEQSPPVSKYHVENKIHTHNNFFVPRDDTVFDCLCLIYSCKCDTWPIASGSVIQRRHFAGEVFCFRITALCVVPPHPPTPP